MYVLSASEQQLNTRLAQAQQVHAMSPSFERCIVLKPTLLKSCFYVFERPSVFI